MGKPKQAHHRGTYHRRSRLVVAAARADLSTRCWRCNRTMAEIRKVKPRAIWTAGHLVDGQIEGELRPECSPCNFGAGGRLRHHKPHPWDW